MNEQFLSNKLYTQKGLAQLDIEFCNFIKQNNPILYDYLIRLRQNFCSSDCETLSQFYIDLSKELEIFIENLFNIHNEVRKSRELKGKYKELYHFKRYYIHRQIYYKYKDKVDQLTFKEETYYQNLYLKYFKQDEMIFFYTVSEWLINPIQYKFELTLAEDYGKWSLFSPSGQLYNIKGTLFKYPSPRDAENLISDTYISAYPDKLLNRKGFNFNGLPLSLSYAADQLGYCIKCHLTNKDYCSKGYPSTHNLSYLTGCPLRQKISEMNTVMENGYNIAALAIITLDNPMVAATGQRICNDCSKACIFQKQDQVDIPHIETAILETVLNFPYGFEIYRLLTQWNPLNFKQPLPYPPTHKNILIAGMGPAGFTLAYYLLRDGHTVVGADSCKIEPLSTDLLNPDFLIRDYDALCEDLHDRQIYGFGGVMEYGITVRWNKNYLKVIRLILERHFAFHLQDSFLMDKILTSSQAIKYNFAHIAYCTGAGKPKILNIKNSQAIGVRQASDFLMSLQLGGAYKFDSLTNIVIRMPLIIIGGGLTAVDTATEAQNYYISQIEKFMHYYVRAINDYGKYDLTKGWSALDHQIADEFIKHFHQLENHRKHYNNIPLHSLINSWGGTTIIYYQTVKSMQAYKLNHHELELAFKQGIKLLPDVYADEIMCDEFNHVTNVKCSTGHLLPAKSVLVAIGVNQSDKYKENINHNVSCFGDIDPAYAGSVVKALASAKNGYQSISEQLRKLSAVEDKGLIQKFISDMNSYIIYKNQLNPTLLQLTIYGPLAVKNYEVGQFYKLQTYATDYQVGCEPIALNPVAVDYKNLTVSFLISLVGASTTSLLSLKIGSKVSLLGPCGNSIALPNNQTVILIGEDNYCTALIPIARQLRRQKCIVIFIAYFNNFPESIISAQIMENSDYTVFASLTKFKPLQTNKIIYCQQNLYEILYFIFNNKYPCNNFKHDEINQVIINTTTETLSRLQNHISENSYPFPVTALINAPMQCMTQGLCGQCIHKTYDPINKKENYYFSCEKNYQKLELLDIGFLKNRHQQNSVWEKINKINSHL